MIGATASKDAAESFAQNRPSGLEKVAMKAVNGAAWLAVRLMLQKASFQHRTMLSNVVEAIPGAASGSSSLRICAHVPAPSMRLASITSRGTSRKNE